MTYQNFIKEMKAQVEQMIKGATVRVEEVDKNNGVILTGLSISNKEGNVAPTFYLEEFFAAYREGDTVYECAKRLVSNFNYHKIPTSFELEKILDFEKAKDNIVYRLVHYKKNEERLKRMPHFKYLDLAVIFYYQLHESDYNHASMPIYDKHLDTWKISRKELMNLAKRNTPRLFPCQLLNMKNLLKDFMNEEELHLEEICDVSGGPLEDNIISMFVLSNEKKLNGATSILYEDVLKDFARACGGDFYLLPSSIHEVILVPAKENTSIEEMTQMVREVNESQVEPEELLSDHAYYYNSKMNCFV